MQNRRGRSLINFGSFLLVAALLCLSAVAQTAEGSKFPSGTFAVEGNSLTFGADGVYRVKEKDEAVVEGVYAATKDDVTFTDKEGKYKCEGVGKYGWKYGEGAARTISPKMKYTVSRRW